MVTAVSNVYKLLGCSHMFYTSLKASPNKDDNTGLNLLKLLDNLDSFGNEFRLPKENFEFGSSSGVVSLEDHPLSHIGGGDVNITNMEHENQFGKEQAYGHPPKQQGYECLNDQPNLASELAIAQSLNADMERNLCN
ncbi:hypothetical protein Tco_0595317, partial [Tanacetum coccineum]